MSEDAWLGPRQPRWVTCTRCNGTGKSAGGDCPDCRIDGVPVGRVRVESGDQ